MARAMERPSEVLPTPGGPTKHRMGPLVSAPQPAHGQVLEDALLHLVEAVVVVHEDLLGLSQVQVVGRRGGPRQRQDPVEVGAGHRVLRRRRHHLLQPPQLPLHRLLRLRRQLRRLGALAQLVVLGAGGVRPGELLLDLAELLAQVMLALGLAHLLLDLVLDAGADLEDLLLPRQHPRHELQALGDVDLFQDLLLLLQGQVQVEGDQVGQAAGVLDVDGHHLQLLRQLRGEVDHRLELGVDAAHQPLHRGRFLVAHVVELAHLSHEEGIGRLDRLQGGPSSAPG